MLKLVKTNNLLTFNLFFQQLLSFTYPYVEVSDVISLDPVNFELPSTCSEETVTITPPCAHTGPAAVHVRLISHALREGQVRTEGMTKTKYSSGFTLQLAIVAICY